LEDIEKIVYKDKVLAIIVRGFNSKDGVTFFTPEDYSMQIGMLNRDLGFVSRPHTHPKLNKNIKDVMETVTVLGGKIKVKFYGDELSAVKEVILKPHDSALFIYGGHGYEVIEKCKVFTVKQGPYPGPNIAKNYIN